MKLFNTTLLLCSIYVGVQSQHLDESQIVQLLKQINAVSIINRKPITAGAPRCPSAFEYDKNSGYCVDVNECERSTHNCSSPALCLNHAGSFQCIRPSKKALKCPKGYAYNWHLDECLVVDECISNPCPSTQACINEFASGHRCLSTTNRDCPNGYKFQQDRGCIDIDECTNSNLCEEPMETCKNIHGSYICVPPCPRGFRMIPNLWECVDIDECLLETDKCRANESCVNNHGGYDCELEKS